LIYRICNRESVRVDAAFIEEPIADYQQASCAKMYADKATRGTMYLLNGGACRQSFDRATI